MKWVSPVNRYRKRHRSGGYILIVTLALLVTSTTLLVAIGRAAVQHALDAHLEVDRLQREWAVRSASAALLPRCEQVLKEDEQTYQRPAPLYRATVHLAGRQYDLTLADEQAKADVNALIELTGLASTDGRIRDALSGTGMGNELRLHPVIVPAEDPGHPPRLITSPGQIFEEATAEQLFPSRGGPLDRITCFGDGSLNILRASEPAARLALGPALSINEVGRLIAARDAVWNPKQKGTAPPPASANLPVVDRLLADAKIVTRARAKLAIVGVSKCHSLTIVARDGRRAWYYLYVSDESNPRVPRLRSFIW